MKSVRNTDLLSREWGADRSVTEKASAVYLTWPWLLSLLLHLARENKNMIGFPRS